MRYDPLGFPVPPEFDAPPRGGVEPAGGGRGPMAEPVVRPGRGKRLVVAAALAGLVAAVAWSVGEPVVGPQIVRWSIRRAIRHEARGDLDAAVADLGRAARWVGDDPDRLGEFLIWRALLRLQQRDPHGALDDCSRAVAALPLAMQPRCVRALVHAVLARGDDALTDAEAVVGLAGAGSPEALNHRAYIRALVGRDLEAALADVDAALARGGDEAAYLDTRGYLLHLLGRHTEAIDQLNLAIEKTQRQRREVAARSATAPPDEIAHRLRGIDHGLAVMHQHRAVACRAAGLEGQARQDFEIAERCGYDPTRGIF